MIVNIASKNPIKVGALEELIPLYDFLSGAELVSFEANSGVSEQPKSMEETVMGAVNRARKAYHHCDYSFGIESGLMKVPHTKTGNMDFCACAIYDGRENHIGFSCAFEFPIAVTRMINEEGLDASESYFRLGLTESRDIGSSEGVIGLLTRGRITRKDYTKQAIQMALIQLENRELY